MKLHFVPSSLKWSCALAFAINLHVLDISRKRKTLVLAIRGKRLVAQRAKILQRLVAELLTPRYEQERIK
jgi:hypothetical protein